MRVWDVRTGKDVKVIKAHQNEILSFDFNKYDNLVATGSTDNTIKVWVIFLRAHRHFRTSGRS